VVVHQGCLAVFLVDVYSNVYGHFLLHLHSFGWLERGNHLFARHGAFIEPLQKSAHSHTRPTLVSAHSGLPTAENSSPRRLETFHPFTHTIQTTTPTDGSNYGPAPRDHTQDQSNDDERRFKLRRTHQETRRRS
jgi:hypothetical protein